MASFLHMFLYSFYLILLHKLMFRISNAFVHKKREAGYFNGSSFIALNTSYLVENWDMQAAFKTCHENGTLFHLGMKNMDEVTILLESGKLFVYILTTLEGHSFSTSLDDRFDDNTLVTINIHENPPTIALNVDDKTIDIVNATTHPELHPWTLKNISELFIGSGPDGTHGFSGCIEVAHDLLLNAAANEQNIKWSMCPLNSKTCNKTCLLSNKTCLFGTCVERSNLTICECFPGYVGSSCNKREPNPCISSPCLNEAICESQNSSNYTCHCTREFYGVWCENKFDYCISEPCQNNGTCQDLVDGFRCVCNETGFTGDYCDLDFDECSGNPCPEPSTCANREGYYECVCPSGYQGDFCNITIDYCLKFPCFNGGTCYNDNNQFDGYACRCVLGFIGKHCEEEIDSCLGNNCNATSEDCISEPGRFNCVCKRGFSGANCEEINECLSLPCHNQATCLDEIDQFTCLCLPGYEGAWCQIDINECEDSPCKNGATCSDLVNGYYCSCKLGWTGKNCSEEFNPCGDKPCQNNGTCTLLPSTMSPGYKCSCVSGFTGTICSINVDDCVGVLCQFNEVCIDGINSFSCDCTPGYIRDEMRNCSIDFDECHSSPCQHGGICQDDVDRFRCSCPTEYEGEMCENEVNFCDKGFCQHESICQPSLGSYTCYCRSGYVGKNCEVLLNACTSDPCMHGACRSVEGEYSCDCDPGYDGINCGNNIDECLSNPCLNAGECNDLIGEFNCTCAEGWDGLTCENDIDECMSNPCMNDANCTDEIAGYTCSCVLGYVGTNCEFDVNECESMPCQHHGSCINEVAFFRCVCRGTGYEGDLCETEIDECKVYQPCENGGQCVDLVNDYECLCQNGYSGSRCEDDIDECVSDPCLNNATCLQRSNQSLYPGYFSTEFTYENAAGFVCNCKPGYEGILCEIEIDECVLWEPCYNNATCTDLLHDYRCSCNDQYGGRNCTVELVGCENGHRCSNSASCVPYLVEEERDLHNYTCGCTRGFTGPFCNYVTTGSFDANSRAVFLTDTLFVDNVLSLDFRTTVPTGFLASLDFKNDSSFFEFFFMDGMVHVSNGNQTVVIPTNDPVNDGKWNSLDVNISNNKMSLKLEDNAQNTVILQNTGLLSRINLGSDNRTTKIPYTGCVRDLALNSRTFAISEAVELVEIRQSCIRTPMCSADSCGQRGACVDLWTRYKCDCYRPYFGKDCNEELEPSTFGYGETQSYALFELPMNPGSGFNFSAFLLTRESRGLIMHAGPLTEDSSDTNTPIRINLFDGALQVSVSEEENVTPNMRLNDGEYHFIDVKISENRLNIALDGVSYPEEILSSSMYSTSTDVYIGGIPQFNRTRRRRQLSSMTFYKGIIQDARSGDFSLVLFADDVANDTTSILSSSLSNVLRGKISDPVCGSNNESDILNPCQNNGTCKELFNAYKCSCTEQWKGQNCDIPIFCRQISCPGDFTCSDLPTGGFNCLGATTFNESIKYISYSSNSGNLTSETLSFSIRTRSRNVTVVSIVSETGLIVFRLDLSGKIEMTIESSGPFRITSSPQGSILNPLLTSDGKWHKIVFAQNTSTISLTVDDVKKEDAASSNFLLSRVLSGVKRSVLLGDPVYGLFIGCMSDVRISGELLPFYRQSDLSNHSLAANSTSFSLSNSSFPVLGCHRDDVCSDDLNPCENNGTCIDDFNLARCSCLAGFADDVCSTNKDDCLNVTCSERGVCIDGVDEFSCECAVGYEGTLCEREINECLSTPCLNNGTCHDLIGLFECDCKETNFTGNLCELDASNSCSRSNDSSLPCLNGATCLNHTVGNKVMYRCVCSQPFYGDICENENDFCADMTCFNDGYCAVNYTTLTPYCQCSLGYWGIHCQNSIKRCTSDSCLNNATCYNTTYDYNCSCAYGYFGNRCENINLCLRPEDGIPFCSNGGTCFPDSQADLFHTCVCSDRYTGPRCQFLNPCYNYTCHNEGTCLAVFSSNEQELSSSGDVEELYSPAPNCSCQAGYTGKTCETYINQSYLPYPWIIVVGAIAFIVLIGITVWIVSFTRKARSNRGTYSPQATETTDMSKVVSRQFSALLLGSVFAGLVVLILVIAAISYFLVVVLDRRSTSGVYSPRKREAIAASPAAPGFIGMELWPDIKPPPRCERLI